MENLRPMSTDAFGQKKDAFAVVQPKAPESVITSYSIHYTKLYELDKLGMSASVAALHEVEFLLAEKIA